MVAAVAFQQEDRSHALQIVRAQQHDCEAVVKLFGALHAYNASLDAHFALSTNWQIILRNEFYSTVNSPDKRWFLVKDSHKSVGLLIASIHTDSPLYRHRQWVEVEALYVASSHRRMGIARQLLDCAYAWAAARNLNRVQLYVTATNVRAQNVYTDEGFITAQAIMRKTLG